jgi:hypothetical protein
MTSTVVHANDLDRARALLADDPDEMDEQWLAEIIAAVRAEAKAEGYDAAVKALRTAKPEQIPKPTIAELEAILNSPAPAVHINPDGSISAGQGQFEKAADWLAANRPSSTGREG